MSEVNAAAINEYASKVGPRGSDLGCFADAVDAFRAFNERAEQLDVQLAKSIFGSARAEQERRKGLHAKAVQRRRKRKKGGPK
ncbi:hypothetical protein SEA_JACKO_97 [Microbacterium phage Jacko]|nr:hypothetical protein SEA_JACKO_97 [Microbacterium phage Jacko]